MGAEGPGTVLKAWRRGKDTTVTEPVRLLFVGGGTGSSDGDIGNEANRRRKLKEEEVKERRTMRKGSKEDNKRKGEGQEEKEQDESEEKHVRQRIAEEL